MSAQYNIITFRVSRSRWGGGLGETSESRFLCLCVCVSVRGRMPTLLHGPGCNLVEY